MDILYHIIYTSMAVDSFHQHQLPDLLAAARKNNRELDITGRPAFEKIEYEKIIP